MRTLARRPSLLPALVRRRPRGKPDPRGDPARSGGQRGTEVEVNLTGPAAGRRAGVPLLPARDHGRPRSRRARTARSPATFKIAPDAPLGLHDFRVRTATGISPLKTFSVGALKDVAEVEPNNDFAKPQPIAMNVTVNGVADNEDVDYYAVKAKKGDRITAEVEGIRLGLTLFDPYVAILDAKRFELASSDDSALIWQDGFVSVVAPEDGTYIVLVRESAYAGNANCLYRLHVGNFPRPTATVPAGGKLGEPVTVRWIGDVLGERTTSADPARRRSTATSAWSPRTTRGPPPTRTPSASARSATRSRPSRTTPTPTATPFTPPVALNGVIGAAGDVDHLRLQGDEGPGLRRPRLRPAAPLAARLGPLRSPRRAAAASPATTTAAAPTATSGSPPRRTANTSSRSPTTSRRAGPTTPTGSRSAPVAPSSTLSTPNESLRRGTGTMAVAVPRGNRQAILINAAPGRLRRRRSPWPRRASPPGVDVRGRHDGRRPRRRPRPVLGRRRRPGRPRPWPSVAGKPVDPKLDVPCEFTSTAELVLGQNNVPFWTRTVDSLAVAVTEEAPVLDRDRRAQGAARPGRVDGPEGRRQAQARLHRADRGRPALEPAGRRLEGRGRHPREGRTRP